MIQDEIIQHLRRRLAERAEIAFAYLHGSFLDEPAFYDIILSESP
jgi:hypothetical protein